MKKFKGCYTAIVTPFKNSEIDFKSLENLLEFQINSKISGIVPCGSTGEGSVLDEEEYLNVIRFTVEKAKNKKQVIAGFGTNSTYKTLKMLEKINKIKLDGLLIIVPYYNKPTQQGMIEHFSQIAKNTNHDIILYNIPSRTGVNMLPETVKKLSEIKNIKGIKEASGNLDQVSEIINITSDNFSILSGDDSLTLPMMSIGGDGVISVVSNLIPSEIQNMCELFTSGKIKKAQEIYNKYFKLIKNLFIETNPIPVKYALKKLSIIDEDELRLPLVKISQQNRQKIDETLKTIFKITK
ncbi:MAG: 4-hydroxy-tetrahydrodipicolinate synthase [Elusimicrobiales bacterium]|nr:4-hydroxy-tetrahydrodipicolinate synthase [Elusimicrobiales bacterium]